ncbi:hypothetical protein ALC60_10114 [Trachymyrmex zeteki]|uniref:Uncharacterized protein n=1 Tax=Mycetomoellerius zeteki TaxID=64791 RepID=A0A151WSE6_9HYME|nr:hypothetical protein ALC60_10114 [Trachymyrmex zeteki]
MKDEEKDDGCRAAGEGPSFNPLLTLSLLQFPILRSSTYIPADTARCSCFYHYCYYNFEQQEADAKDGPSGEDKMVKKRKKKWLRYHRFEVIRRRMNIRTELTTYPPIAPILSLDPSRSESPPSTSGSFHKARPAYH